MTLSMYQIYNLLPKTNCRKCGFLCMAFAAKLISRDAKPEDCPILLEEEYSENLRTLKELLGEGKKEETGLIIHEEKCTGCGICVTVCDQNYTKSSEIFAGRGPRFGEEVVIRIENGVVRLINPKMCKRLFSTPVFCRACAEHCLEGAIDLV